MRIALTVFMIAAGLLARPQMPQAEAAAPTAAPYEATIVLAAFHLLSGEKDCTPFWDI